MLTVHSLQTEYLNHPMGLDPRLAPRFSWKLSSPARGVMQSRYQLEVATDSNFNNTVYDSGQRESAHSTLVPYEGPLLEACTQYFVRVRVWDVKGNQYQSEPTWFETGLAGPGAWQADWISADGALPDEPIHHLRRAFTVSGPVQAAHIYATARGVYSLCLNGHSVGNLALTPGWTSYRHHLLFQTYDVTHLLKDGPQAIGAMLANGWYKGELAWQGQGNHYGDKRSLLLELHIRYEDGREEVVTSDTAWRAATGPVLMSELYHGETYDARLELSGWDLPDYDDTEWVPVQVLDEDKSVLAPQMHEGIRVTERITPKSMFRTPAGELVLDMGQNMVGWVRFQVQVPRGTVITLRHAEVLDKEGNFYTENLRAAKQTIVYIAKGDGVETYRPNFTFQGFRYVHIDGLPEDVPLDAFVGEVIHSDFPITGEFECSNPLVNQLQRNIVWGQRGNFVDVPTDCPQRDERLGWTGDAQVFLRTAAFNANVAPFFRKWLKDLAFDQFPDGGVPAVIPNVLTGGHNSSAWGDAAVICPWELFIAYGDLDLLRSQYPSMKAWVEYIRAQGDDELLWNTGFHYGDWLALDAEEGSYVGSTPRDLIATAFFAYSAYLLSEAAGVLGYTADQAAYKDLHDRVARRFRDEFITPSGRVISMTQTAHVLPLMFRLVDGAVKTRLAKSLADMVVDNKVRLKTGFVGTPYLCHVLSDNGYHDLASQLVTQTEYPSWLYSVGQGATTIWEHWDGIKPDGSFWSKDMNSFNHYAYGSIGDWLYRRLAGLDFATNPAQSTITQTDTAKGTGRHVFRMAPTPSGSFSHARAAYESLWGPAESGWQYDAAGERMTVRTVIPGNASAEVVLPGARIDTLMEGGLLAVKSPDLQGLRQTDAGVELTVQSGTYVFSYPYSHRVV